MSKLQEIFAAQIILGKRFLVIEKNNGLAHPSDDIEPLVLPSFHNEARLRAHAWRIVEEASELSIAEGANILEEVSDILHFLTEFSVLSGIFPDHFSDGERSMEYIFDRGHNQILSPSYLWKDFITQIGLAVNQLKNRPWKLSQRGISIEDYRGQVCLVWYRFGELCSSLSITSDQLYNAYFSKHQENERRIENGV